VAGGVAGIHLVDGHDEAAADQKRPHAIDEGAGEERIVVCGGIGHRLAAGELGDGRVIGVTLVLGGSDDVFVGGVLFLRAALGAIFFDVFAIGEDEVGRLALFLEVREVDEPPYRRFG